MALFLASIEVQSSFITTFDFTSAVLGNKHKQQSCCRHIATTNQLARKLLNAILQNKQSLAQMKRVVVI
jgi:hypothetical protein